MSSQSYLVVGGGILGATIAERLAVRGADVTVLIAPAKPGTSATERTLGWINDTGVSIAEYRTLRTIGKLRLAQRQLVDASRPEGTTWYHQSGRLDWASAAGRQELPAHNGAHRESIEEEAARLSSQGQDAYLISPSEAAAIDPALDGASLSGNVLWVPEDAWVDLPLFARTLLTRARSAGACIVRGSALTLLESDDGTVRGVRTENGDITADRTIVAAGEDTPALISRFAAIPKASTTGVTVFTTPLDNPPRTVLRAPFAGARTDEQGRLVVVADPLEAAILPDGTLDPDALRHTLDHLSAFLAGHPALEAEHVFIGPRPIPGDGLPVAGVVAATGGTLAVAFTHSGATVGYALGQILADELLDGTRAVVLDAFRPERFAVNGLDARFD
ncbi:MULTISPECIES: NAD(P)/FAD-dependent oxidoreductase [Bifidobacterium]|uniref:NAD(P)/FAD-dependent oxidoreductase n=1 Tax=Bifidobacterium TaxID=1678 RepID=UPI001BDD0503|nr:MULTISPECIES: FAD-binding oxidoreductase [Bifidobacterium]MBT1161129.1 FAD-binding oxidoreductase [Bifidobacterium sp. SO1]MBW3078203.1 FAD-binding oxidoreductase [Bifidobacterium simiiventris]